MAKKKRKPHKKPMRYPLSALDKFVYIAACAVFAVLSLGSLSVMILISKAIAYKDASAVAVSLNDISIALYLPLVMFFIVIAVATGVTYKNKKPLFGNKSFVPRQDQRYKQEAPVFSAEFWQNMSEKAKLKIFRNLVIGILIFAISLSLSLLAIHPRTALCENGEIKTYNSFNELTETRNIEKADYLIIRIVSCGGTTGRTSYRMDEVFVFGGKEYAFSCFSFDNMETKEALVYMLRLKSDFKGKHKLEGSELIDKFCKRNGFTAEEKALVYELFDYNG